MSPERFDPERFGVQDSRTTKESDCYALGMVILEVLSGQVPFASSNYENVVVFKVLGGEQPERPQEAWFTNDVWGTLEGCWAPQPRDRPELKVVLQCLEKASPSWTTLLHLVSSTANSSDGEFSDRDSILTVDVSQVTPASQEVMSQFAHERLTQFSDQRSEDLARRGFDIEDLDKVLSFHQSHHNLTEPAVVLG